MICDLLHGNARDKSNQNEVVAHGRIMRNQILVSTIIIWITSRITFSQIGSKHSKVFNIFIFPTQWYTNVAIL